MRVLRTYLELNDPAGFRPAFGDFPDLVVTLEQGAPVELYRSLYRGVGENWQWVDRRDWTDDEIRAHLSRPEISLFVARQAGRLAGFYELRRVPEDSSIELAYFGLLPNETGKGLGKHLLSMAVREAFSLGARRVWVHTCSLDHPASLPNYVARGFVPFRWEEYAFP